MEDPTCHYTVIVIDRLLASHMLWVLRNVGMVVKNTTIIEHNYIAEEDGKIGELGVHGFEHKICGTKWKRETKDSLSEAELQER